MGLHCDPLSMYAPSYKAGNSKYSILWTVFGLAFYGAFFLFRKHHASTANLVDIA
jgi:hypothetical protein